MGLLFSTLKGALIRGSLLLLAIMCIGIDAADCAERVYYSIHLASFEYLRNANAQVNALKKRGKIVFWKKTHVPGKGEFYRVYLGRYKSRAEALEFWEKLKKDGAVSYCGIHEFTETVVPKKIEEHPGTTVEPIKIEEHLAKTVPQKPDGVQVFRPTEKGDRFLDNQDGTVTDTITNLMWIKNGWRLDFVSAVTWWDAVKGCENFRHGGYANWRLPTIQEWKSLLDTKKECPALVEPNPFENIIVHMPYWSRSEFIYGPEHTCITVCPIYAYTVMLYHGNINHLNKSKRAFILPVRSID